MLVNETYLFVGLNVMYSSSDIVNYNDVFSHEDYKKILSFVHGPNWYFGHGSHAEGDKRRGLPFWRIDFIDNNFFAEYLLNIIEEKTQQHYELCDVYANGHTYGTQGSFHQDWYDERGRTFLFYANDVWRLEWGGKTAFNLGEDTYFHIPKPNAAILFPGIIPHAAEPTSRTYAGLRITIAWKLLLKDS